MSWALLAILFACFSSALAHARGRSAVSWFFIGLLFGPFGLLVGLFPVDEQTLNDRLLKKQGDARRAEELFLKNNTLERRKSDFKVAMWILGSVAGCLGLLVLMD